MLTQHNQENAQWSPDPFPRKRVGHETMQATVSYIRVIVSAGLWTGLWTEFWTEALDVTCT